MVYELQIGISNTVIAEMAIKKEQAQIELIHFRSDIQQTPALPSIFVKPISINFLIIWQKK